MQEITYVFQTFDYIGTSVFAISGALAAMNHKLDPIGVVIIAFVTAIGGGSTRDMLIGNEPVMWMRDINYFYIISISAIIAMIVNDRLMYLRKTLLLFDTIGLGVFSVLGADLAFSLEIHPVLCVLLGVITASFGGLVRDILVNEVPAILHKEIYASAALMSGITLIGLYKLGVSTEIAFIVSATTAIIIRLLAVRYKWIFPRFYEND